MFAPAPALPPVSLESVFVEARAAAARAEDPIATLKRAASPAEKLAALEALHGSLPLAPAARRAQGLEALRLVAASGAEAPAVRAKALMYLGYAVPVAGDENARAAAVTTLLDALAAPDYRIFALRGLASATHDMPQSVEGPFQSAILDLLDEKISQEDRITALIALDAFVRARGDLSLRRPDLAAALDERLLAPIEAAPAAFATGGSPAVRSLTLAVVWHGARNRAARGRLPALERVNALLKTVATFEKDASVKAQIAAFLAAPPPAPQP